MPGNRLLRVTVGFLVLGIAALSAQPTPTAPRAKAAKVGTTANQDSSAFTWTPPELTRPDSLFIIAATGEPRFQAQRDSCRKILIAKGGKTLKYLLEHRLTGQTPRQRHYVKDLFVAIADSGRNPEPAARLTAALPLIADSIKVQLLYIGSDLADTGFLKTAKLYLKAGDLEVRRTAIRSLGMYPREENLPLLLEGMNTAPDLEKQDRLWAISKHPPLKEWRPMLPLLGDSSIHTRIWARQILVKSAGSWPPLAKYFSPLPSVAERREWALLAGDFPGPEAAAFVKRQIQVLGPDEARFIVPVGGDTGGRW